MKDGFPPLLTPQYLSAASNEDRVRSVNLPSKTSRSMTRFRRSLLVKCVTETEKHWWRVPIFSITRFQKPHPADDRRRSKDGQWCIGRRNYRRHVMKKSNGKSWGALGERTAGTAEIATLVKRISNTRQLMPNVEYILPSQMILKIIC